MRNMKKKIITIVCAAVFSIGVLCACSGGIDNQAKQELLDATQNQISNATMEASLALKANAAGEQLNLEMPIKGEIDITKATPLFHLNVEENVLLGIPKTELFLDENGLTAISGGEVTRSSLAELSSNGLDLTTIMSISNNTSTEAMEQLLDSAKSLKKSTSGDKSLYTMELDASKLAGAADTASAFGGIDLADLGLNLKNCTVTYAVNGDGIICGCEFALDMDIEGNKATCTITVDLTNIGTTTVPAAPAA